MKNKIKLKLKWLNEDNRWTVSLCGTPEKAEGTWDDNGRDGLTSSKDLHATNGPEMRKTECCGKNLKKKKLYRTCSPIEHTRAMPCSKSRRLCPFRAKFIRSFIQ